MVKGLCRGSSLARGVGAGRARGAAESAAMGGYRAKASFPAGRVAIADGRARLDAAAGGKMNGNLRIGKALGWWEKGVHANMTVVESAQHLTDSLLNAGDKLVVVDFFSPSCSGCRALHPKIAQFAEQNPEVLFLLVNYEKHRSMCYSLHVHVLPFFRFYRGAQGRVSSFSCTNATISKFRGALAKHGPGPGPGRCSAGAAARGLEESELAALAANRDLDFTRGKKPTLVPIANAVRMDDAAAAGGGGPWLPPPASLFAQEPESSLLLPS